jgi:hypothetical protein
MVAGVLASLGAVEGMTDDAIEGFEQIIDRLERRVGIRTVNRRRSRPGLAHPAHAVSNPAAASHRNLSPTVLGWSYTPSIGVTTSTGIVGYHNAAKHEPSARPESVDDAARRSALPAPSRWCMASAADTTRSKLPSGAESWETARRRSAAAWSADAAASISALSSIPTSSASGWRLSTRRDDVCPMRSAG